MYNQGSTAAAVRSPGGAHGATETCGTALHARVTMDWWPNSKCDYGECSWLNSTVLTVDLADPLLSNSIKALSPALLRIGGSLADQLVYAGVPNGQLRWPQMPASCDGLGFSPNLRRRIGFAGGCLPWLRWLALLEFCSRLDCRIMFSVNALHGRKRRACPEGTLCRRLQSGLPRPPCCSNYSGSWDSRPLRALLRATAESGHALAGLAYGNELVTEKGIEAHFDARWGRRLEHRI